MTDIFCNQAHPAHQAVNIKGILGPTVWCRRLTGHDGPHAAFTLLISQPETWPAT